MNAVRQCESCAVRYLRSITSCPSQPVQWRRKSVNKVRLVSCFLVDSKSPATHQQTRVFIASSCYVCYHKFSYFKVYVQYTYELTVGGAHGVCSYLDWIMDALLYITIHYVNKSCSEESILISF
jgi:hypothetical protein